MSRFRKYLNFDTSLSRIVLNDSEAELLPVLKKILEVGRSTFSTARFASITPPPTSRLLPMFQHGGRNKGHASRATYSPTAIQERK